MLGGFCEICEMNFWWSALKTISSNFYPPEHGRRSLSERMQIQMQTRSEKLNEKYAQINVHTFYKYVWVRVVVSLIALEQQHTLMMPIFLSASASDMISHRLRGQQGSSQDRTLLILWPYITHIILYQRVTNWPPPMISGPHLSQVVSSAKPKSGPCPIFYPPLLFSGFCLSGRFWRDLTSFLFPILSRLSMSLHLLCSSMKPYLNINHSPFFFCHSDRPSTGLRISSLYFLHHSNSVFLSLIFSFSCSPPYTNTSIINCGSGNYIEPTSKFHFHLHLD